MKKVIQPLAWYLVLASVLAMASGIALSFATGPAMAASSQHQHQHGAGEHLPLPPPGQQWASDAPLREGMAHIRQAFVQASHEPIDDAQARELAQRIEAEVASMISHCVLPEKADAALHGLFGELLRGTQALVVKDQREQAMAQVVTALNRYPQLFDDPHWHALEMPAQH